MGPAVLVLLGGLVACVPAADPPLSLHVLRGEAFGTTWSVKWRGELPLEADAAPKIAAVLDEVDRAMSSWRPDSEINRIRHAEGPVPVGAETATVIEAALDLAAATAGAFDPTVEPLMALWGFRGERRSTPPTEAEIDTVMASVGWQKVRVRYLDPGGEPVVDGGGTSLDLSAIAKGHAVDRVSHELSALGATDHLVEIGGEVRGQGGGPTGSWRLGIDWPDETTPPGTRFAAVIALRNAALATSGNYRNFYDAGGAQIVHTMDPRTGRPHASEVASVTVVAPDCRTADGWATALMVMPATDGLAAVSARPELDALWLIAADGGFREQRSGGIGRWLVPSEP